MARLVGVCAHATSPLNFRYAMSFPWNFAECEAGEAPTGQTYSRCNGITAIRRGILSSGRSAARRRRSIDRIRLRLARPTEKGKVANSLCRFFRLFLTFVPPPKTENFPITCSRIPFCEQNFLTRGIFAREEGFEREM